jgi:hypothetical protein
MSWVIDSLGLPGWATGRTTRQAGAADRARCRREETLAVRRAMLDALGDGSGARLQLLRSRLECAADAECLWDLRNELMSALAALHGEAFAARRLAQLTPLFRNLVPQGLACRLNAPETGAH